MPNNQTNRNMYGIGNTNSILYDIYSNINIQGTTYSRETQSEVSEQDVFANTPLDYFAYSFSTTTSTNRIEENIISTDRTDDVMRMENEEESIPMDKFDSIESLV